MNKCSRKTEKWRLIIEEKNKCKRGEKISI